MIRKGHNSYLGVRVALATKHDKERAIGPAFRRILGAVVVVPPGIDTDQLGTFTGEIPRVGTPLQVVRKKARLAMKASGIARGIASEGSFGPHPATPFIAAGFETMIFIDDTRGIEITGSELFDNTNFGQISVSSWEEARVFLQNALFPSHRVIVSPEGSNQAAYLKKGIGRLAELKAAIQESVSISKSGRAKIETDMRAHMNPTRMSCLRTLAINLARRLNTKCPACGTPGWGVVDVEKGLPCESCHTPTDFVAYQIFACLACACRQKSARSDGKRSASAAQCPYCNP